jgi:surface polysaccharide O-acyltransferase-like enzyme
MTVIPELQVSAPESTEKIRENGIDAFRWIMASLIVLLHSLPFQSEGLSGIEFIDIACRSAVPFFFVVSGFFLPRRDQFSIQMITRPLRRLVPIYLFWILIYAGLQFATSSQRAFSLRELAAGGTGYHLWFLPALGFAQVVVSVGNSVLGRAATAALIAALAAWGLASGAYHDLLGMTGAAGRGGIFVAPAFVFLGNEIARIGLKVSLRMAIALVTLAFAASVAEIMLFNGMSPESFRRRNDFLVSTFVLGPAVFLLARAASRPPAWMSRQGTFSLGIYASHLIFVNAIVASIGNGSYARIALVAACSFTLATLLTRCMHEVRLIRPFVA